MQSLFAEIRKARGLPSDIQTSRKPTFSQVVEEIRKELVMNPVRPWVIDIECSSRSDAQSVKEFLHAPKQGFPRRSIKVWEEHKECPGYNTDGARRHREWRVRVFLN